ncbi:SMC5-SMC6 complex localization factor protein 2-like [Heptranchias perlo]|uniref:SMC5-SMC6 complex localization factor protein 2-like n=1 Tax=Heptranchias perlo TaxID=212740 RepID=UPI00355AA7AE
MESALRKESNQSMHDRGDGARYSGCCSPQLQAKSLLPLQRDWMEETTEKLDIEAMKKPQPLAAPSKITKNIKVIRPNSSLENNSTLSPIRGLGTSRRRLKLGSYHLAPCSSQDTREIFMDMRWYEIPLSSPRKHETGLLSERFQTSLQEYKRQREIKRQREPTCSSCYLPLVSSEGIVPGTSFQTDETVSCGCMKTIKTKIHFLQKAQETEIHSNLLPRKSHVTRISKCSSPKDQLEVCDEGSKTHQIQSVNPRSPRTTTQSRLPSTSIGSLELALPKSVLKVLPKEASLCRKRKRNSPHTTSKKKGILEAFCSKVTPGRTELAIQDDNMKVDFDDGSNRSCETFMRGKSGDTEELKVSDAVVGREFPAQWCPPKMHFLAERETSNLARPNKKKTVSCDSHGELKVLGRSILEENCRQPSLAYKTGISQEWSCGDHQNSTSRADANWKPSFRTIEAGVEKYRPRLLMPESLAVSLWHQQTDFQDASTNQNDCRAKCSDDCKSSAEGFSCNSEEDDDLILVKPEDIFTPVVKTGADFSDQPKESYRFITSSPVMELIAESTGQYLNNFDCLLKEKEEQMSTQQELEKELHGRTTLSPTDDPFIRNQIEMQTTEEMLAMQHRVFVEKFSVHIDEIPAVHPGQDIFRLPQAFQLFNEHTLRLECRDISPRHPLEKLFFSSSPAQQISFAVDGFVSLTYGSRPCPQPVLQWLFQLMSVHTNSFVSLRAFKALWEVSTEAITQAASTANRETELWSPSVQEIVTAFVNLGASFTALFPLTHLQPDFTMADLKSLRPLDKINGTGNESLGAAEPIFKSLPVTNLLNVFKFLTLCAAAKPHWYSDGELLLLIVMLCQASLDARLCNVPSVDLQGLLQRMLDDIQEWDKVMAELCAALSSLSAHHHDLLNVVKSLPDTSIRGRQLQRHLSLAVIGKLVGRKDECKPAQGDVQISALCHFLRRMKPACIVKRLEEKGQALEEPRKSSHLSTHAKCDKEVYYLCYNLLTLVNVVVGTETLPSSHQKDLEQLCQELDRHIKSSIKEDLKLLYRSKVKDLAARTYAKWQELLTRNRAWKSGDCLKHIMDVVRLSEDEEDTHAVLIKLDQ